MAHQDEKRFARNQSLIDRMAAPSTPSQLFAYLDEELKELIQLAVRMDEGSLLRGLREARRELSQMRRAEDLRKRDGASPADD